MEKNQEDSEDDQIDTNHCPVCSKKCKKLLLLQLINICMFFPNMRVQIWRLVWSVVAQMASIRLLARMNPDMPIQHRDHLEADRTFGFTQIDLGREVSRLKQLQFTLAFNWFMNEKNQFKAKWKSWNKD